MKKLLTLSFFLCLILAMSSIAFAHKIRVFAYAEADQIIGETAFSGGRQPKSVEILVTNANDDSILLTTLTDDMGKFSFPVPEIARNKNLDLRITVNGGDGHSNSWLLEAADYLPDAALQSSVQAASPAEQVTVEKPAQATREYNNIDPEILRSIVDESIARQLAPVKHMLAKNSERKLSLQDILGGIGYIIGLAGLATYMQSKKGERT